MHIASVRYLSLCYYVWVSVEKGSLLKLRFILNQLK